MEVRGRDGQGMEDLWAPDGARAYLGTMLPGFPNLFMLYGPNTNQVRAADRRHGGDGHPLRPRVHRGPDQPGKRSVDATLDGYWRYNRELDEAERLQVYVDPRAHNYYQNEHGRSATNGPLDARLLWHWLRSPASRRPAGERPVIDASLLADYHALNPHLGADLTVQ